MIEGKVIPQKDFLVPTISQGHFQVRRLAIGDYSDLLNLAAHSHLPTLADPPRLKRGLERRLIFGAFIENQLVGCCCIELDVRKEYLTEIDKNAFPLPNVYFCGAFVLSSCRESGIGYKLYQQRLDFAKSRYQGTIVVELLGDGSKSSVHHEAVNGYKFYQRHGFKELGYSIDADAGKVFLLEIKIAEPWSREITRVGQ